MQTSIGLNGRDSSRVTDVRRYSASDESLDALKARTTPPESTNPYVTAHASCAQAFLATAISQQDRLGEMLFQHEDDPVMPLAAILTQTTPLDIDLMDFAPLPLPLMPQAAMPHGDAAELTSVMPSLFLSDTLPELILPSSVQPQAMKALASQVYQQDRALPLTEAIEAKVNIETQQFQLLEFRDDRESVQFSGKAPVGALVQFFIDDVLVGSAEVDDGGQWQFAAPSQVPAAEHRFSAVIADANGAIMHKIDFAFIHQLQPEMMLLPIDDGALKDMDDALIALTLAPEEAAPTIKPLVLPEAGLDAEQTLGGISVHLMDYVAFHQLENDTILWH